MFKNLGWYLFVVFLAIVAAFWMTTARAHETNTQISIYSAHNPAPRFHDGPNSHPPHQHHGHRPSVYVRPAPVYQQPPTYYFQPEPIRPPVRGYQQCQRYDGWRQQYIYVPC